DGPPRRGVPRVDVARSRVAGSAAGGARAGVGTRPARARRRALPDDHAPDRAVGGKARRRATCRHSGALSHPHFYERPPVVIPAHAGIQPWRHAECTWRPSRRHHWIPACMVRDEAVVRLGAGVTDGFPYLPARWLRYLPLRWTDSESAPRSVPNVDKECSGPYGPPIALQAYVRTASP